MFVRPHLNLGTQLQKHSIDDLVFLEENLITSELLSQLYQSPVYISHLLDPKQCHIAEIEYPFGRLTEDERSRTIRMSFPDSNSLCDYASLSILTSKPHNKYKDISKDADGHRHSHSPRIPVAPATTNQTNKIWSENVNQSCMTQPLKRNNETPVKNLAFTSLPISSTNENTVNTTWLAFRLRRDTPLPLSRSGLSNQSFLLGTAVFRSCPNSDSRRGAKQESFVVLSPLPPAYFFSVLLPLTKYLAETYFLFGSLAIYDGCASIGYWPHPLQCPPNTKLHVITTEQLDKEEPMTILTPNISSQLLSSFMQRRIGQRKEKSALYLNNQKNSCLLTATSPLEYNTCYNKKKGYSRRNEFDKDELNDDSAIESETSKSLRRHRISGSLTTISEPTNYPSSRSLRKCRKHRRNFNQYAYLHPPSSSPSCRWTPRAVTALWPLIVAKQRIAQAQLCSSPVIVNPFSPVSVEPSIKETRSINSSDLQYSSPAGEITPEELWSDPDSSIKSLRTSSSASTSSCYSSYSNSSILSSLSSLFAVDTSIQEGSFSSPFQRYDRSGHCSSSAQRLTFQKSRSYIDLEQELHHGKYIDISPITSDTEDVKFQAENSSSDEGINSSHDQLKHNYRRILAAEINPNQQMNDLRKCSETLHSNELVNNKHRQLPCKPKYKRNRNSSVVTTSRLGHLRPILYSSLHKASQLGLRKLTCRNFWEISPQFSIQSPLCQSTTSNSTFLRETTPQIDNQTKYIGSSKYGGLLQSLGPLSVCLWTLWEIMITESTLLVIASNATRVSSIIFHLLDLISPLEYGGDFRPYTNAYDPDLRHYSSELEKQQNVGGLLVGGSDPLLLQLFASCPNVMVVESSKSLYPPHSSGSTGLHGSKFSLVNAASSSSLVFRTETPSSSSLSAASSSITSAIRGGASSGSSSNKQNRVSWLRMTNDGVCGCVPKDPDLHRRIEELTLPKTGELQKFIDSFSSMGALAAAITPVFSNSPIPANVSLEELNKRTCTYFHDLTLRFIRPFDIFLQPDIKPLMINPIRETPISPTFTPNAFIESLGSITSIDAPFSSMQKSKITDLYKRFMNGTSFRKWLPAAIKQQREKTKLMHLAYCAASDASLLCPKMSLSEIAEGCAHIQALIRECKSIANSNDIVRAEHLVLDLKKYVSTSLPTLTIAPPMTRKTPKDYRTSIPIIGNSKAKHYPFFHHWLLSQSRRKRKVQQQQPSLNEDNISIINNDNHRNTSLPRSSVSCSQGSVHGKTNQTVVMDDEFLSACED